MDLEENVKRLDASDRRVSTGAPRWVRAFGITAIVIVLLVVLLHVNGHGLGGHNMKGMERMGPSVKPP